MSGVEKISVAITPESAAMIRQAVAGGDYASSSEVIRDALRLWMVRRDEQAIARAELRRLWADGVDSGASRPLEAAAIKRRGRDRLAAKARPTS
jgi:antitoxin ParD1/3/4